MPIGHRIAGLSVLLVSSLLLTGCYDTPREAPAHAAALTSYQVQTAQAVDASYVHVIAGLEHLGATLASSLAAAWSDYATDMAEMDRDLDAVALRLEVLREAIGANADPATLISRVEQLEALVTTQRATIAEYRAIAEQNRRSAERDIRPVVAQMGTAVEEIRTAARDHFAVVANGMQTQTEMLAAMARRSAAVSDFFGGTLAAANQTYAAGLSAVGELVADGQASYQTLLNRLPSPP